MLRILHISDFHICDENLKDSESLISSLTEVLEEIEKERQIDLIIFSGDAINKGGNTDESGKIKSFRDFEKIAVSNILQTLNLNKARFIIAPGNHDIQRNKVNRIMEIGLQTDITDEKSIETNRKEFPGLFDRCAEFKEFEKAFYDITEKDFKYIHTPVHSIFKLKINDLTIGILTINTAWRCFDSKNDHKHNVAGKFQIEESIDEIKDCDILMAVSHHHHSLLKNFDDKEIGRLLLKHFSLYFTGHTHSPDADLHVKPTACLYNFVASGVLSENVNSTSKYKNGFTIIDYDILNGVCSAQYYYQKINQKFELDTTVGENGIWQTHFPIGPEAKKKKEIQNIYIEIEDQIDEWNKHLLGWDNKTESEQNIRDIFVMPEIKYDEIISPELNKTYTNRYVTSLQEILNIKGNVLIQGVKESGKTLLLDRLILEIVDNVNKYSILPARIKFENSNNIILHISNFWRLSRNKVKDILKDESVVVFVDDINDEKPNLIKYLSNFCEKYPNVRILATCRRNAGMDISRALRVSSLNFTVLEILNFGAKQIRELTKKWFKESLGMEEMDEYIATVIDTLSGLNLPPSPFAISMFLSILQKNRSARPKNQSLLTKEYLEELLNRGESERYGRNEFNSQNRLNLIVSLAKKIYNKSLNEEVEGLSIKEAYEEIEAFLKSTGLDMFNQLKILQELLDSSIFIEEFNILKFRFRCFYEFYIAIAMTMDPDFKSQILKNYLRHSNEIVFYTGLETHNRDVLEILEEDLSKEFDDFDEMIAVTFQGRVDNVFNYTKSLVGELAEEGMTLLLPEKQTEEEKIDIEDSRLQSCDNEDIKGRPQIIDKHIQRIINFGERLSLTMNVLRNVEDLKDVKLKTTTYETVVAKSIVYASIYTFIGRRILAGIDERQRENDQYKQLFMSLMFLPAFNVDFLFRNLGSMKLISIIKTKIEKDKSSLVVSEFEKFISVFLYCEIKGKDFFKELKHFCERYQRAYIADSIMMKLHLYYHTSHVKDDNALQNMIADVYIKEKTNNDPSHKIDKNSLINQLKSSKKKLESK